MASILLVEDDERLAKLIQNYLNNNGYQTTVLHDGNEALSYLANNQPDLVILDVMLPGIDGFALCETLKATSSNPILFLTAKDSDADHLKGLALGADDYIIKPVDPQILTARIKLILKRAYKQEQFTTSITFGELTINKALRKVFWQENEISMTCHEYELLVLLAENAGEPINRDFIHKKMIGREYNGLDRTVDVRVFRLRKKFGDDIPTPQKIATVWGKGYMLNPNAWHSE